MIPFPRKKIFNKYIEMLWVLELFLFVSSCALSSGTRNDNPVRSVGKSIPEVDALLKGVLAERWSEQDMPCLHAVLELLHQIQNNTLWATWIWDSMQRPSGTFYGSRYQFGNYDQCLQAPWSSQEQFHTQYCLADLHLADGAGKVVEFDPHGEMGRYFKSTSKYGRHMHIVTWGVCLPAVCSSSSVMRILRLMYLQSHLAGASSAPHITIDSCQKSNVTHQYTFGYHVFIYLITTLIITAVISTLCYKSTNDSFLSKVSESFCMERNWNELTKVYKDEIQSINGIRFITTGFIVGAHYICYSNIIAVVNALDVDKALDTNLGKHVIHLDLLVETFFVISGLLHMKGIISARNQNLFAMILRRYLRFIGPFALIIFYMTAVSMHLGSGPMWHRFMGTEQKDCQQNWWLSLLMLNNIINSDRICYVITWYIQCDYQLAIMAVILYYFYRRNRRSGIISYSVVFILSMMTPAIITFLKQVPPIFNNDIDQVENYKQNEVFTSIYMTCHSRASAYFVGMGMGYFMTVFKPNDYRKVIPKNWSLLGFLAAIAVMQKVLAVGGKFLMEDYTNLEAATFVACDKIIWAAAICCIIAVCEYGSVPIVSSMLKSYLFVPLSRLSYGIYLIHMLIIFRSTGSMRAPTSYDFFSLIVGSLGVWLASSFMSLLLWFTVEAPLINISNHLFRSKKISTFKPDKENGDIFINGNGQYKENGVNIHN